jgi:hypothetical protein
VILKLFSIAAEPTLSENPHVAVQDLAGHEAAAEVKQLTRLVAEALAVTWALRIALPEAVAGFDLCGVEVLAPERADNLHIMWGGSSDMTPT